MYRVHAPSPTFTGQIGGLQFHYGVADHVRLSDQQVAWFRERRYHVVALGEPRPATIEQLPASQTGTLSDVVNVAGDGAPKEAIEAALGETAELVAEPEQEQEKAEADAEPTGEEEIPSRPRRGRHTKAAEE